MNRFHDCGSCAFEGVETAVCDVCDDADQWEPADPECEIVTTTPRIIKTMRFYGKKKDSK